MSDNRNENMVGGFLFDNEAEAAQADKEIQGVRYIKEKADMDDPEMVLHIYNKMIQQSLFETVIGFSYLKELQEYLQSIPFIRKEEILPIPVSHPTLEASFRRMRRTETKRPPEKNPKKTANTDYKRRYQVTRALSIVLAVCVVAMFAITATANNTTILNYETELINKYEAWEQELSEREAAVLEREQLYDMTNE